MTRIELNNKLKTILGTDNVYYQPPENVKIKYPCIIYNRVGIRNRFAGNSSYLINFRYSLQYISTSVDTENTLKEILKLPMCSHNNHFKKNNLNHDSFTIYI